MAGSHKRDLPARRTTARTPGSAGYQPTRRAERKPRSLPSISPIAIAAPAAVVATGLAVSAGLALNGPASSTASVATAAHTATRPPQVSRSEPRAAVLPAPTLTPLATHDEWATADLNLYAKAGADATPSGELAEGKKVTTTDVTKDGRVQVLVDGVARWVTGTYLSTDKPLVAAAGLSDAPCPDSSVERGLKPQTIRVYRALCHAFPQVTEFAGWAPRSEHDTGNAIDAMVYGDKALGDAIAAWAQQHAAELDLYDLIWYDRIWTPVRSSEGWRDYGDHGSPTANHMDHVHLGTN